MIQIDPSSEFVFRQANESMAGMEDMDPETEALAEFDFLVTESGEGAGEARSHGEGTEWGKPTNAVELRTLYFGFLGSIVPMWKTGVRKIIFILRG